MNVRPPLIHQISNKTPMNYLSGFVFDEAEVTTGSQNTQIM